ncbi:MAG: hypothetical protein GX629_03625 [Phycisphaerae bacterium]|nr:hypothetical protein [Phycisphaerae bacterium]
MKQVLKATYQPGTYTFTAAVGTANGFVAAENNRLVIMQGTTWLSWVAIPQAEVPMGSFADKSVTFVVPDDSPYIGSPITIMLFASTTSQQAQVTCFDHIRLDFTAAEVGDFGSVLFESNFTGLTGEDIALLPEWSTGVAMTGTTRTIDANKGKFYGNGGGWYYSSIRADASENAAFNFNPITTTGNRFEHTVVAAESTDPQYAARHRSWIGPQWNAAASAFNVIGERLCCEMRWAPETNEVTIFLRVINSTATTTTTGIAAQTLTTTADLDDGDQIRLALQVRDNGGNDVRIAYKKYSSHHWSDWTNSAWVNPTSSSYDTNAFASDWKTRWSNNTFYYIETTCRNDGSTRYPSTTWIDDVVVMGAPKEEIFHGDANNDGKVDVGDLGILAANYGRDLQAQGVDSSLWWSLGDFNDDGKVDVGDLGILAANYGRGTSGADFNTDYANVFGTTADDASEDAENIDSSLCNSMGLPLIAGLLLAVLILAKLEE